ncbi:MAG TPA: tRNA preQ1(34) S-adenosylmethionine ribosyltransferase-isomerase QueA [Desulfuromonadaceae bacterium]|jgi:S-adenosylmethionine:tRNA ribosyltransferase-isomerase
MLVTDFNFNLPAELIARFPANERDASRLMFLNRLTNNIAENIFRNITTYLVPGDLLVMNDTRVIPARLFGFKESGGKVEIFLLGRDDGEDESWSCLLRASKGFFKDQIITLPSGMCAKVLGKIDEITWRIVFSGDECFEDWLEREGHMPLPPYLQREDNVQDRERYQTVFAKNAGAVAAPTAGLHFTQELLISLQKKGVETAHLTLHTGLGTFQPMRVKRVQDHRIHRERYFIPAVTADAIRSTKKNGGRVVAVGTTTARTLEHAAVDKVSVKAGNGEADIFIIPGYDFKMVDALVTNFHLPESTLLMLVSAFAGRDFVLNAYQQAVSREFRFYSYGDAMLIV